MIKGEPIKTYKFNKVTPEVYKTFQVYFSVLSTLGLALTKVQVRVLAAIAWKFNNGTLGAKEKKAVAEIAKTTLQVVDNTLVALRKKGIIRRDNSLNEKFYFDGRNSELIIKLGTSGRD